MLKKLKENKVLKFIGNLLYIMLFLLIILMLVVVVMQRVSDNSITVGGVRMFTVATGSMIPVYDVGDVLIAKEVDPNELKVGDDVVYRGKEGSFKNRIVTHRIISIEKQEDGNYKIITQGVANEIEDPEIDQTQVYGKIIYQVKTLSFIGKMIKNIYVFYFIIFIPIGILIFKQIKGLISSDDDEEEDDDKKEIDEKNEE